MPTQNQSHGVGIQQPAPPGPSVTWPDDVVASRNKGEKISQEKDMLLQLACWRTYPATIVLRFA
jgi:hypothetical protein